MSFARGILSVVAVLCIQHLATSVPLVLSCEGVITVDEQGEEPMIYHSCLNHGCAAGCTMVTVIVGIDKGETCSCQGQVPSCCHLVLVENDPVYDVVPTGNCGAQESECPSGDTCKSLWRILEPGYLEARPNCITKQN
jgi:hypothetical protein